MLQNSHLPNEPKTEVSAGNKRELSYDAAVDPFVIILSKAGKHISSTLFCGPTKTVTPLTDILASTTSSSFKPV